MSSILAPTKPHYKILDGLRGVAALVVVAFHVFEASATSHLDQIINHGYLAVDFFFLLSGFVIGYAVTSPILFTLHIIRSSTFTPLGLQQIKSVWTKPCHTGY